MKILTGQKVSNGIAIGEAMVLTANEIKVKESYVTPDKVEAEIRRFHRSLRKTEQDFRALRDHQDASMKEVRGIIDASLSFLRDDFLVTAIEDGIREHRYTAPYSVSQTIAEVASKLQVIDNPSFSSKVADMIDIEHRLLNHLLGGRLTRVQNLDRHTIVVADDLTPTQAATLDRTKVLGFATTRGSWASHTAILARALGIPAVVGVRGLLEAVRFGSTVIVDGFDGRIIIDPDQEMLDESRNHRRRVRRRTHADAQTRNLKSETRDGEEVGLYGNIETKSDVPRVFDLGGEGVGLYRTEFLFLGQTTPLSEDEQYEVYRSAVEGMQGGEVTIRSIDFGADKFDRRFGPEGEANPFMGERAIRISFRHQEFFKTQLRAILRAAVHGPIRLMFPMIMDVGEFIRARGLLDEAKAELRTKGIEFSETMPVGSMIELPSAALNAEHLAEEAGFFSIGTNDLTQYVLGVDRTNQRVAHLYASHHPSVLALIDQIVRVAKRSERSLSVCGEMAGVPEYVPLLLGLGVRSLSVAPPQIPIVKRVVRSLHLPHCIRLAERALEARDAHAVGRLLDPFRR